MIHTRIRRLTRNTEDGSGISKSQVSRLCEEIDDRVKAFLDRTIEDDWPYVWLDATYVEVRRNHRIVSVAVIIAAASTPMAGVRCWAWIFGPSEAETFWTEFLRKLRRRGLRGTKLVISDAHEGIKAAVTKLMNATWQRCRVHTMRNALAHMGKSSRRVVAAFLGTGTAFAQDTADARPCPVAQDRGSAAPDTAKTGTVHGRAETDVPAYMSFPPEHWVKLHSTNGLERHNGEVKRRTDVVGIFPNDEAIFRLVGSILLEQNDEWAVQRGRYMTQETMAGISEDLAIGLPAMVI